MTDRKQKAYDYFKRGYGCAPAVLMAFEDVLPLDKDTLEAVSVAFGCGFGNTKNLCGAVSAMGFVTGLVRRRRDGVPINKAEIYRVVSALDSEFKARNNGTDNCPELLSQIRRLTENYVPDVPSPAPDGIRPCIKFVLDSVDIIESELRREGMISD